MGSLEDDVSCSDGGIFDRVVCILTYGGSSATDIVLNYCTIAINLVCCILIVGSKTTDKKSHEEKRLGAFLLFVVVFQISLCLAVGCSGVSVIWCAMGGWIASQRLRAIGTVTVTTPANYHLLQLQNRQQPLVYFSYTVMVCDAAVVLYYFFAVPFITTIAHICAVVMGALLSELSSR